VADLVAFSPELIREQGTYSVPNQFPVGISLTMVAGVITMRDGAMTGARPGRALRS
jgi:N-acyl-D-aspartate/D-glutamate deacylase